MTKNFERYGRKRYQDMEDYRAELQIKASQMQAEDPGSSISTESLARRLLRRAALTKYEQKQVLATAGATWNFEKIRDALLMLHDDVKVTDRTRVE